SRSTQNSNPSSQAVWVAAIEFGAAMTNKNSVAMMPRSSQRPSGPGVISRDALSIFRGTMISTEFQNRTEMFRITKQLGLYSTFGGNLSCEDQFASWRCS